ncbi:hypothetical protein AGLY_010924 [Aphis glycines]|uniref:Uncharacterized protein n=1 Tax=Aphis glycines TaxID=307491 RepID=A0A6G0TCD8_APHGL|nr:hypothetical protein AGLY_010924 [Aphis glycines]
MVYLSLAKSIISYGIEVWDYQRVKFVTTKIWIITNHNYNYLLFIAYLDKENMQIKTQLNVLILLILITTKYSEMLFSDSYFLMFLRGLPHTSYIICAFEHFAHEHPLLSTLINGVDKVKKYSIDSLKNLTLKQKPHIPNRSIIIRQILLNMYQNTFEVDQSGDMVDILLDNIESELPLRFRLFSLPYPDSAFSESMTSIQ